MVRKLMKHELYCIFRIVVIPMIVMVLLAILCRLALAGTADGDVTGVLLIFYLYFIFITLLLCFVFGLSRFYKTLFTGEGYMTLSLPVSADQLIVSNLLSSIITLFAGVIVCILSACIFLIGVDEYILNSVVTVLEDIGVTIGLVFESEPLFVVEAVLFLIVCIPAGYLEFYFIMAIAQLCTVKNRKFIAVVFYIGVAFVWSLISPYVYSPVINRAAEVSIHLSIWLNIIMVLAVDIVCYLVVRYILKNKINLVG